MDLTNLVLAYYTRLSIAPKFGSDKQFQVEIGTVSTLTRNTYNDIGEDFVGEGEPTRATLAGITLDFFEGLTDPKDVATAPFANYLNRPDWIADDSQPVQYSKYIEARQGVTIVIYNTNQSGSHPEKIIIIEDATGQLTFLAGPVKEAA